MRRLFLCLMLLAVGCRAQGPATGSTGLDRSIEKQFRSTFNLPPYVEVTVGERKPSEEFAGYDKVVLKLSYGGQSQTREMLLSKDS